MAETKKPNTAEPTAKKKPSAAALQTALAQLQEEESGKKKNTVIFRILAFVCWALAAVAMYLPDIGLNLPFGAIRVFFLDNVVAAIIDIVVAGILCVIGARLWVYANHIHPTKSHSKFVQFVWNQLGIIMAGVILAPLAIILILNWKDERISQKTKAIVAAVLAAVFVGAAAGSADYHPVTQDQVNDVVQQLTEEAEGYGFTDGDGVRWTKYGNCYHIFSDCHTIRNSENYTDGTIEEAVESNRARLCTYCIKRYAEAKENGEEPGKISLTEKIGDLVEDLTQTGDQAENGNE